MMIRRTTNNERLLRVASVNTPRAVHWQTGETLASMILRRFLRRTDFRKSQSSILFANRYHNTASTQEQDGTTHFGFRDVEKKQKEDLVRGVFDSVADNYDVMNDLMSGTLHRYWKDEFVNTLHPLPAQIIDVAGGTGDVASDARYDLQESEARYYRETRHGGRGQCQRKW